MRTTWAKTSEASEPRPGIGVRAGVVPRERARGRGRLAVWPLLVVSLAGLGGPSGPSACGAEPPQTMPAVQPEAPPGAGDPAPAGPAGAAGDAPAGSRAPRGRSFLGIPPLRELLDDSLEDEDEDGESTYFPEARNDPVEPDIRKPGPDTANFPNSPYTLRQGRFYIEASPLFLSGPSAGSARTYNVEFLLRFGLTDRVELRLFGNGPTFERGKFAASGIAPIAYDIKTNLWKENEKYHIPAVGLEVFLLTASGSPNLNQATQPSINLLFDYTLPFDFLLEWNVGIVGDPSPNNHFSALEPAVAWALQHEVVEGFDVFFQGYFNGPTLPRFGDGVELGGGFVWALNTRISLFGSYNGGVSKAAPASVAQFGGAVAF